MSLEDNTTSLQSVLDLVNSLPSKSVLTKRYLKSGTQIIVSGEFSSFQDFGQTVLYLAPSSYTGQLISSLLWIDGSALGTTAKYIPLERYDLDNNKVVFSKYVSGSEVAYAELSYSYVSGTGAYLELTVLRNDGNDILSYSSSIPMALISTTVESE